VTIWSENNHRSYGSAAIYLDDIVLMVKDIKVVKFVNVPVINVLVNVKYNMN